MSDYEEDFTGVQSFPNPPPASIGIGVKIPPLFDGSTSCVKYEELIDDWLDLTQLETGTRGPGLRNRLVGDASMYKRLLDTSRKWSQVFQ